MFLTSRTTGLTRWRPKPEADCVPVTGLQDPATGTESSVLGWDAFDPLTGTRSVIQLVIQSFSWEHLNQPVAC